MLLPLNGQPLRCPLSISGPAQHLSLETGSESQMPAGPHRSAGCWDFQDCWMGSPGIIRKFHQERIIGQPYLIWGSREKGLRAANIIRFWRGLLINIHTVAIQKWIWSVKWRLSWVRWSHWWYIVSSSWRVRGVFLAIEASICSFIVFDKFRDFLLFCFLYCKQSLRLGSQVASSGD